MKIPRKISIGGIAFKVRFVKFTDDDYGKMDFDQRLILLNQGDEEQPAYGDRNAAP